MLRLCPLQNDRKSSEFSLGEPTSNCFIHAETSHTADFALREINQSIKYFPYKTYTCIKLKREKEKSDRWPTRAHYALVEQLTRNLHESNNRK